MVEWFRTFITDKSFFEMIVRTVFVALGGAVQDGSLPVNPKYWWVPVAMAVLVSKK
jgi:hypothetical protein